MSSKFVRSYKEKEALNQYWYSPSTIEVLAADIVAQRPAAVAFLSTPSLYYAVEELRPASELALFDYDDALPRVLQYDYNAPTTFTKDGLQGHFDMVVIDPPFITEHVWTKYAETATHLLAPGGKILLTTIAENEAMIQRLLGCRLRRFRPSIPHLVYQYGLYSNYESPALDAPNPEVPDDD
ncbi:hypothetical protein SDRG_11611 [Saprolegnia diclina VS20]|uniref:N6-adenine methyltransferase n=1 Tax=Saprolegnia diclina (strain VS20) TaxID=1156394 RepID=T0Q7G9_SAPDV|nr:hypothetical protein SDRG_11611 [Saprolegnia diclina VS20]EQC30551.1 hypothetical protein SDRG_11611 [Saprolegnia diclina VS20]|eukprot:XP_008615877.1 hypothetical protein SDRG_11611 [Saprolegnia diclina VS20]